MACACSMSTTFRNSRQVSCTCAMSSHPRQVKMWDNTSGGNSVMCLCDHVAVTFVSCEDSPPSGGCLMPAFFATGSIVISSSIGYKRFRPKRYPMVPCIRLLLYIRNNFIGHRSAVFSLRYSCEMQSLAEWPTECFVR